MIDLENLNPFTNPIIIKCKGADTLPIDRIIEFQGKLKKLSEKNRDRLIKSICRNGFISPIFVFDDAGEWKILDGHQRISALLWMRQKGWDIPMLPVDYIEAENEKDARAKLLQISSQYGEFDMDELNDWVNELDAEIAESIRIVDEEVELSLKGIEEETAGDDEIPEAVAPVTKLGDLWELGEHRLLCGDSTKVEDVERLMDGVLADCWLTDPPYNVAYEGKTKEALTIQNDSMDDSSFRVFLKEAYYAANNVMKPGAVFYIWHADSEGYNFRGAAHDIGWKVRQCLIWNKNSMVMGRQDYHWKHEPCLYGWKEGSGHLWNSDRKQTTILNFDRPTSSQDHPTMKPIELFAYCLTNNTKEKDVVLDSFGGSGTTLISAEKTGRIAYINELDPHYCDVIRDRYIQWCEVNDKQPIVKLNGEVWDADRR